MNRNLYFELSDHTGIRRALATYGYCVVRQVIGPDRVQQFKDEIDRLLDPDRSLPPASSKYHLAFAEECAAMWDLVDDAAYMNLRYALIGDHNICLHRSAAILRTAGEPMGGWHSDHCGRVKGPKKHANDFLNVYSFESGAWFYLNGSHPERSGIAVLEYSHTDDWSAPEGFHLDEERRYIYRNDQDEKLGSYNQLDIPGAVPVVSDPGDMILFSALTYHVNMATNERRYTCAAGFRPKSIKLDVPWALPASALRMIERLPTRHLPFTEGYTSIDPDWKP
ncbi:MAG: phytanoyl-CoA dioxygenase family protein [Cephaloticoccus sp.]|nr:phytanoyl-CoA dioxygenase family protein [Cephaloticoccus sp.]MCF7760886.1 phytanoyl-CoA dioxygenase family protein [Cephaloticoccus sp.]